MNNFAKARSCYSHLAGQLGVAIFGGLAQRGAILEPAEPIPRAAIPGLHLELGPEAKRVFASIDIDMNLIRGNGRPLASFCVDRTARRPHLGGALGVAVLDHCWNVGWIERVPRSRLILVTPNGREGLRHWLGIDLSFLDTDY